MIFPFSSINSLKIYQDMFSKTILYLWNQDLYLQSDYHRLLPSTFISALDFMQSHITYEVMSIKNEYILCLTLGCSNTEIR